MVLHWVPDSSRNLHRQGSWGSAEPFLCFGLSISFNQAFFQSFLHSQYLSHSHSLHPLSSRIRQRCLPLAVMLMHFQSGCPLSSRALHVHQADQRPACKSAQIAARRKLLETSFEGDCEQTCQKCRGKKWAPAHLLYANENKKAEHYKGLYMSQSLLDVLMQRWDTLATFSKFHLKFSKYHENCSAVIFPNSVPTISKLFQSEILEIAEIEKEEKKNLYLPPPSFFPVRHFKSSPLVRGIHFHLGVLPSLTF